MQRVTSPSQLGSRSSSRWALKMLACSAWPWRSALEMSVASWRWALARAWSRSAAALATPSVLSSTSSSCDSASTRVPMTRPGAAAMPLKVLRASGSQLPSSRPRPWACACLSAASRAWRVSSSPSSLMVPSRALMASWASSPWAEMRRRALLPAPRLSSEATLRASATMSPQRTRTCDLKRRMLSTHWPAGRACRPLG